MTSPRKITIEIITALLVLLFVYAAISKILDYENFKIQLGKSPLLTSFASYVAIGVPLVELVIVSLLLIPKYRILGYYCSFFLMVLFTAYLVAILNFTYYIPCSCGGILSSLTWRSHIIFNAFFIVVSAIGIVFYKKTKTVLKDNNKEIQFV